MKARPIDGVIVALDVVCRSRGGSEGLETICSNDLVNN